MIKTIALQVSLKMSHEQRFFAGEKGKMDELRRELSGKMAVAERELDELLHTGWNIVHTSNVPLSNGDTIFFVLWKHEPDFIPF